MCCAGIYCSLFELLIISYEEANGAYHACQNQSDTNVLYLAVARMKKMIHFLNRRRGVNSIDRSGERIKLQNLDVK